MEGWPFSHAAGQGTNQEDFSFGDTWSDPSAQLYDYDGSQTDSCIWPSTQNWSSPQSFSLEPSIYTPETLSRNPSQSSYPYHGYTQPSSTQIEPVSSPYETTVPPLQQYFYHDARQSRMGSFSVSRSTGAGLGVDSPQWDADAPMANDEGNCSTVFTPLYHGLDTQTYRGNRLDEEYDEEQIELPGPAEATTLVQRNAQRLFANFDGLFVNQTGATAMSTPTVLVNYAHLGGVTSRTDFSSGPYHLSLVEGGVESAPWSAAILGHRNETNAIEDFNRNGQRFDNQDSGPEEHIPIQVDGAARASLQTDRAQRSQNSIHLTPSRPNRTNRACLEELEPLLKMLYWHMNLSVPNIQAIVQGIYGHNWSYALSLPPAF